MPSRNAGGEGMSLRLFFLPSAVRLTPFAEFDYFFGTQNSSTMLGMVIRKLTPNMPL